MCGTSGPAGGGGTGRGRARRARKVSDQAPEAQQEQEQEQELRVGLRGPPAGWLHAFHRRRHMDFSVRRSWGDALPHLCHPAGPRAYLPMGAQFARVVRGIWQPRHSRE